MANEEILFNLELERNCLKGIYKFPDLLTDIESYIKSGHFCDKTHQLIYETVADFIHRDQPIDKVNIAAYIKNIGITTEINIYDYLEIIAGSTITKDGALKSFLELNKLAICRKVYGSAREVATFLKNNANKDLSDILGEVDRIFNENINLLHQEKTAPQPIFTDMESYIEGLADNPPKNDFYMGPFENVNRIYGSLVRPGALNLVGARTGAKKTSLGLFYLYHVAKKYKVPVLHLDFGEMSNPELKVRALSMLTKGKVPYHAIERGYWRDEPEWKKLVREQWEQIKDVQMDYYNIGNMDADEILSLIRRYYLRHIGRGNRMLIHYDYLKPFSTLNVNTPEWKEMGNFIQKIKVMLTDEFPQISVWMNLQLNRSGITNNKSSGNVDDSEASFSMSDRVIQQATHAWIFRPKTDDEISTEHNQFGNHKFINVKARHLGEYYEEALGWVKVADGDYRKNYINIHSESFHFEEFGDLRQQTTALKLGLPLQNDQNNDGDTSLV